MAPSVAVMRKKRDQVMAALAKIPRVTCSTPQGAFYVLPDVSAYYHKKTPAGQLIRDGHELCMYLLKEYKVALVPGDSFGASSTIRISYATSEEELDTALTRLGECLASLS
jgi:aspartate/methionine/tyrosine aminotransferase